MLRLCDLIAPLVSIFRANIRNTILFIDTSKKHIKPQSYVKLTLIWRDLKSKVTHTHPHLKVWHPHLKVWHLHLKVWHLHLKVWHGPFLFNFSLIKILSGVIYGAPQQLLVQSLFSFFFWRFKKTNQQTDKQKYIYLF